MEQRTNEWHAARLGKFTASEIHKLMGVPKKGEFTAVAETYIIQKVAEELTMSKKTFTSEATDWGTEMESLAKFHYERITEKKVHDLGYIAITEDYGGSPDGQVDENLIIEIKCPFTTEQHIKLCLSKDLKKDFPEYYWQIQMNMLATKTESCDLVIFDPRIDEPFGLVIKRYNHLPSDALMLIDKIEKAIAFKKQIKEEMKEWA